MLKALSTCRMERCAGLLLPLRLCPRLIDICLTALDLPLLLDMNTMLSHDAVK